MQMFNPFYKLSKMRLTEQKLLNYSHGWQRHSHNLKRQSNGTNQCLQIMVLLLLVLVRQNNIFLLRRKLKGYHLFVERITEADYSQTQNLFRIKWTQDIDYALLRDMIQFNIDDKADCTFGVNNIKPTYLQS